MIKSDYIVFDCETGGLSEQENPITQYAAVILDGKTLKEIDRFETYVKPYANLSIKKEALDKTMVSMSDINSGLESKDFVNVITKFWEIHLKKTKKREMGRLIPVGHNVPFDIKFINWILNYHNKKDIFEWCFPNIIDTQVLAKLVWGLTGEERINLTACCNNANIDITDAHGAMNDVESTAELFRFYMKKLRIKRGEAVTQETKQTRLKGKDFFEFTCIK